MRRLVSITAIAALLFSLVSPLLAATCEHGKEMAACHRVQEQKPQKPHCEMMHDHDDANKTPPASDGPAMQGSPSSQSCPMDCCQLGDRANAIALAVRSGLPQPAVTDQIPSIVSVVFSNTGFSSHTDRGPPSA
jgi:hypothetical protein